MAVCSIPAYYLHTELDSGNSSCTDCVREWPFNTGGGVGKILRGVWIFLEQGVSVFLCVFFHTLNGGMGAFFNPCVDASVPMVPILL